MALILNDIEFGGLRITASTDCLHIEESCKLKDSQAIEQYITDVVTLLGTNLFDCEWCNRTPTCLVREWQAHNLLYELGLWKDRTASVDLDKKRWYDFAYHILGWIYGIFH